MNRSKRIFCMLLVCLIAGASSLAEEAAPEITAAPTAVVTPEPTAEPTIEPTIEPTAEPTVEPTIEPTVEPTVEPTAEPTVEPTIEPTAEPTIDPTVQPTTEPAATPEIQIEITVEGNAQQKENVWQIAVQNPEVPIVFRWTPVESATVYEVRIMDSQNAEIHAEEVAEASLSLPVSVLAADTYTMTVDAWLETVPEEDSGSEPERTLLMQGGMQFMLVQNAGGFPSGGRPSGSFGGGSRPSGGSGSGAAQGGAMPEVEQGFRITPGEALTSSHASGSRNMRLYGTVDPEPEETAMTILELSGMQLDVTLDGQAHGFFAEREETTLILTPESVGEAWSVSAFALKTLSRSGIAEIRLTIGGDSIGIPTDWQPQGRVYAQLCAEGYVSKDYTFTVACGEVQVAVADKIYEINENNELVGG